MIYYMNYPKPAILMFKSWVDGLKSCEKRTDYFYWQRISFWGISMGDWWKYHEETNHKPTINQGFNRSWNWYHRRGTQRWIARLGSFCFSRRVESRSQKRKDRSWLVIVYKRIYIYMYMYIQPLLQGFISQLLGDYNHLVGGFNPLKIWVHQLGWWHSQLNGKS